jgi:hypothetical protein
LATIRTSSNRLDVAALPWIRAVSGCASALFAEHRRDRVAADPAHHVVAVPE